MDRPFFAQQRLAMRRMLEAMIPGREAAIDGALCVLCGKPAGEFRDAISAAEYQISGTCQACQDIVFSESD